MMRGYTRHSGACLVFSDRMRMLNRMLTLQNGNRTVQSWSNGWHGASGDCMWVSADEGGDEVAVCTQATCPVACDFPGLLLTGGLRLQAFSLRLDSRYNLGNEWEMIVGVVPAGSDMRDGGPVFSLFFL